MLPGLSRDEPNSGEAVSRHPVRDPLLATAILSAAVATSLAGTMWWRELRAEGFFALALITFYMFFVVAGYLIPVVALEAVLRRSLGRLITFTSSFGTGVAVLFFLLWFLRIEPAHQILSREPHLSRQGLFSLVTISAASVLVYVMFSSGPERRRWLRGTVVMILGGVIIAALAEMQTPARDRDQAVMLLDEELKRQSIGVEGDLDRVLFIGIDGMDWNIVAELIQRGDVPSIENLLGEGGYFQLDNLGMDESAGIWASIYTGVPGGGSGIDGFVRFEFAGVERPVYGLPRFGFHPALYLKEALWHTQSIGLWKGAPASNRDLTAPPVWRILAASRRRVAVIDPVPTVTVPEKLDGLFVTPTNRGLAAYGSDGERRDYAIEASRHHSSTGAIDEERAKRSIACELLGEQPYDAVLYYTHFVDSVSHFAWRSYHDGGIFRGDPASTRVEAIAESGPVREAYIEADRTIATLRQCFGPSRIVIVSDHGWDYSDHEHFHSPHGMLVISPVSDPGYGGVVSILRVAPTVLELSGVAPDERMRRSLDLEGLESFDPVDWSRLEGSYIRPAASDERIERLKSLGYLGQ